MQLVRMLFVAIVGVLGFNVDGMQASVLDFDGIFAPDQQIPESFQPEWNDPSVEGNDATNALISRYIFFSIKDSSDEVKFEPLGQWPNIFRRPRKKNQGWYGGLSREQRQYKKAKNGEYNIYFLADGTQPTTEEAIKYSCANVEDDAITDWYMKMFGVIDKNGGNSVSDDDYVKAGFFKNNSAKIINFDDTMNENQKICIREAFRRILSTPPGRLWAYRMLIEIRRINNVTGGGAIAGDTSFSLSDRLLSERNRLRCIDILYDSSDDYFDVAIDARERGCIACSFQETPVQTVSAIKHNNSYRLIVLEKTEISIDLFHELLHWFHFLRHIIRCANETVYNNAEEFSLEVKSQDSPDIDIAHYYYSDIREGNAYRRSISAQIWKSDRVIPCYEEMRTILGMPSNTSCYIPGDELSENLYRLYSPLKKMRFGHVSKMYLEDERVIQKAIAHDIFGNNKKYIYDPSDTMLNPISKGLGECKVNL